mgnify:CR=1 FL=1
MQFHEIKQLNDAAPNEVWAILLRSGIELVSQIRYEPALVGDGGRLFLYKPFTMRTISVPMQTPQGIHINSQPQMQPFMWLLQSKELPLHPEDVWYMTGSPKKLHDAYVQETSGIIVGGH